MKKGCGIVSPLSGAEPEYSPETYNKDPAIRHSHNCYAYAMQVLDKNKIKECKEQNKCGFHVPGRKVGHPDFSGNLGKTCSDVIARTMADINDGYLTDFSSKCKPNYSKVAMIVDSKRDMHYIPQVKKVCDANGNCVKGAWATKSGAMPVVGHDAAKSIIMNPERAHWYFPREDPNDEGLYYDKFCAYMCVPRDKQPELHGGKRSRRRRVTRKSRA